MNHRLGTVLAALLGVALGTVLLWPDGALVNRGVVAVYVFMLYRVGVPAWVGPEHYAAALNVLALVPFGWLGVVWLRRRVVLVVAVLGGASVLVETLQLLPVLHRQASLLDVACNTGGALLGALAGSLVVRHEAAGDELVDEGSHVGRDDLR